MPLRLLDRRVLCNFCWRRLGHLAQSKSNNARTAAHQNGYETCKQMNAVRPRPKCHLHIPRLVGSRSEQQFRGRSQTAPAAKHTEVCRQKRSHRKTDPTIDTVRSENRPETQNKQQKTKNNRNSGTMSRLERFLYQNP